MGVRGLSSFFNQNPELSSPFKLHSSVVIVDGNNLIHALYFNYKLNFMYGGDYKKYSNHIWKYMSAFLECNIKPIIIFDGGYEKSDRKLKTVIERSKNRLTQVQYIAKYGSCSGKVLPILAYEVFYSVLTELNIIFAQCDFEADDQVTALANYYKCPVISGDSDFYIFDVHHGFIHLDSVNFTINLDVDCEGKEFKFLSCSIYYIDQFVRCFPGLDKNALPLFGTLMGNDFVKAREFENFFSNIQLPKYKGRKLILNSKQKKMMGVLSWLQHNTLNEAVNAVILYLKKDKREYVKSIIENSINGYNLNQCSLSFIIDKKVVDPQTDLLLNSRLKAPCGNVLPLDFIMKFHVGYLPSFFINVIVLHRVFLQPQVEDMSLPSTYSFSCFIRQILYGILIRHDINNSECTHPKCLEFIEEYDRNHNNLCKELVAPIFSLEGIGALPKINNLSCSQKENFNAIILNVLGINSDFLHDIPGPWQLLIGCINSWLRNSTPYNSEAFIYAVALNLIYFSLIKSKNSFSNRIKCSDKTALIMKCMCISCLLSNVSEADLQYAGNNLEKYSTTKPSFNCGNPLFLNIIHGYSQLQAYIMYTVYLNKLLGCCMENPNISKSFSGTMLYNLTKDITSRPYPKLFVSEILGRDSNLDLLLIKLKSKMCKNVPDNCILKNSLPIKSKKSKKKKESSGIQLKNNTLSNKFEILGLSDLKL